MTPRQHPDNVELHAVKLALAAGRFQLVEITYLDGSTEHGAVRDADEDGFLLEDVNGCESVIDVHNINGVEVIDA